MRAPLSCNLSIDGRADKMTISLVVKTEVADLFANIVRLVLLHISQHHTILKVFYDLLYSILVDKVFNHLGPFFLRHFVDLLKEKS